MKQILNKLIKRKTKRNKDIGKTYYNIEMNEEEINKINSGIKSIKRAIRNRKNNDKNYDDNSLRITELKNSIIHYENDISVLKDKIKDFENSKNKILIKMKRIRHNIQNMTQ